MGALGQIGTELVAELQQRYGGGKVLAIDIRESSGGFRGSFERLDVLDRESLGRLVKEYDVGTIYHLAAILSASGEKKPELAWRVNVDGLCNVLDVAREHGVKRVFHPSSIAVFGPETPRENTPEHTVLRPRTIHGVSKVVGELLGLYYFEKWGVDVRGIRFPGVISSEAPPGGGTTDYTVEMFYAAVRGEHYTCFLREDSRLPMIYMPDCLKFMRLLMDASSDRLV